MSDRATKRDKLKIAAGVEPMPSLLHVLKDIPIKLTQITFQLSVIY